MISLPVALLVAGLCTARLVVFAVVQLRRASRPAPAVTREPTSRRHAA